MLARMAGPRAWRSLVSALVWGTRGPEFESRRPDAEKAPGTGPFFQRKWEGRAPIRCARSAPKRPRNRLGRYPRIGHPAPSGSEYAALGPSLQEHRCRSLREDVNARFRPLVRQKQPGTGFGCCELDADRSLGVAESEDDLAAGADVELCPHLAAVVDQFDRSARRTVCVSLATAVRSLSTAPSRSASVRAVSVTASLLFVMTPIYTRRGDVVPDGSVSGHRAGVRRFRRDDNLASKMCRVESFQGGAATVECVGQQVPLVSSICRQIPIYGRSRTWRSGSEPRSRSSRTYAAAHTASGAPALPRAPRIPLVAPQLDLESVVKARRGLPRPRHARPASRGRREEDVFERSTPSVRASGFV